MVKLTKESRAVKEAANLSLERLQSTLRELENGLELVKVEISLAEASHENEKLLLLMIPFHTKVEEEVIGLRDLYNTTLANLRDLTIYFGENLKQEQLIDIFKTMRAFFNMFDQVTMELWDAKQRETENTNKPSQGSSSYSLLDSPARHARQQGAQRRSKSPCNVEISKGFLAGSKQLFRHEPIDLPPFLQPGQLHSSNLDQEGSSASHSRRDHQQHLLNSGQTSKCMVRTMELGDNITKTLDPLATHNPSYDSDWSTG